MHMTAIIKGKPLADAIKVPASVWETVGNGLVGRIQRRTEAQNVDADGRAFAPYSEGYARTKGKKSGLGGGGPVNLIGAGAGPKMLRSMRVRVLADANPRVTIDFSLARKAEIALYHMGEGRVDRLFFGLSDDDLAYATALVKKAWAT